MKTLPALTLMGLLYWAARHVQRTRERSRAPAPALPEPLRVWEDEGGQSQMLEPATPSADPALSGGPEATL